MTTIAYRDGIIAYDSLVTCQGVAVYKNYDKTMFVNGCRFFIAGSISDYDSIVNGWFSSAQEDITASAIVVDSNNDVYECGYVDGKMFKEKIIFNDQYFAIGSGWQFALMAMDLGLSAEDAVKKASERCIYTGGVIRCFKVN